MHIRAWQLLMALMESVGFGIEHADVVVVTHSLDALSAVCQVCTHARKARHGTALHGTAMHGTARYGTARHCTARTHLHRCMRR